MIGKVQAHLVFRSSGPAVVMVHGSQAWSYAWRFQIQALAQAGYQAIAVDLPGNGYSVADANFNDTIKGMANFLIVLLDNLQIPSAVLLVQCRGAPKNGVEM